MSNRRRALTLVAGAVAIVALISVGQTTQPALAFNDTDPCTPGDRIMLVGGGTGDMALTEVKDCGAEAKWHTTATYRSEKEVIFEKRGIQLSFSYDSALNPFTTDYSYTRARDLFPDPTDAATWSTLKNFALDALSPKVQSETSRKNLPASDSCRVYPTRATDEDIKKYPGLYKLPPLPTPDGKTGTISFALAPDLTSEQRTTILDALTQYDGARSGSKLPQIVVAPPGGSGKPTITFRNGSDRFEGTKTLGEAVSEGTDIGRDGLTRWKDGSIYLTSDVKVLSETLVVHELLHVLGFQHTPSALNAVGFSETTLAPELIGVVGTQRAGSYRSGWSLDESVKPLEAAIDPCTKKGMSVADANY